MFPRVFRCVSGSRARGKPAIVHGYRRYRLRGQVYPAIVPRSGERVEGVLYCGISPRQWRRLDAFEGRQYQRKRVHLENQQAGRLAVWIYVIAGRYRLLVGRHPWDPKQFARRHRTRLF